MPKVSVIVPNYNHAPYLRDRIESILNQTYSDYEIILLDDKSTDNSVEIINEYSTHPKVSQVIINETNSGSTFKQWRKGIELAKGEYIWIAESDDVAEPDFIELLMKGIGSSNNVVLAFSNLDFIDKNSNLIKHNKLRTYQKGSIVSGDYFIRHNMLFGNHILNASSVIFKKKAFQAISNEYLTYKSAGDYLFWIEIISQGQVYKTGKTLDHFRQHNAKVTPKSQASGLQNKEVYNIFKSLESKKYITYLNKQIVIGFWLTTIENNKDLYDSNKTFQECLNLWMNETRYPWFAKIMYKVSLIHRLSMKYGFNHNI